MAARASEKFPLKVQIVNGVAEDLHFDDASFDTVVSTFSLCSVDNNMIALAEARRVLRPGGRLLFCEHGLANDLRMQQRQRKFDRAWSLVFGGCHINRPVKGSIEQFFKIVDWQGGFQGQRPSIGGWMEWGEAQISL